MKVVVLHGYSADNAGDGLLVDETLSLIRDALGADTNITIAALHPETFVELDAHVVDSSPRNREYRHLLRSLDSFDAIFAVGGGYLRAGYPMEMLKTSIVHGPQLWAAARSAAPTVYLPQSVGPAHPMVTRVLVRLASKIDSFYVRDDRSLADLSGAGVHRAPDLAILGATPLARSSYSVEHVPVVSVRAVRGHVGPLVVDLAKQLGTFDGYVQSTTGGNNDVAAMRSLSPRRILSRAELMGPGAPPRVVVAVRLHAALMAQRAGLYVIHLAYERKGFGAFDDLGLGRYVHNVNKFEPVRVLRQVRSLLEDETERRQYAADLDTALAQSSARRTQLISSIRDRVPMWEDA